MVCGLGCVVYGLRVFSFVWVCIVLWVNCCLFVEFSAFECFMMFLYHLYVLGLGFCFLWGEFVREGLGMYEVFGFPA